MKIREPHSAVHTMPSPKGQNKAEVLNLPILSVFLMTTATCPLSTEPKSLTIIIRQPQRTRRETLSRMMPTARSGRLKFTKMCWPEETQKSLVRWWEAPCPETGVCSFFFTEPNNLEWQLDTWELRLQGPSWKFALRQCCLLAVLKQALKNILKIQCVRA